MVVEVVVGWVLSNSSYTVDCKDTDDYYTYYCVAKKPMMMMMRVYSFISAWVYYLCHT